MKNKLFAIAWAIVCPIGLLAQPDMTISQPKQSLGDIMFQNPKTITYTVRNTGNKPLVISEVHPSCGCVKASFTSPISVGETGQITAVYDAAILGTFYRELEVYTNASEEPTYLSFNGRVVNTPHTVDYSAEFPVDLGNVRLSASALEYDDVNRGDKPVAELQVVNLDQKTYTPQLMHLPSYLTAEYFPDSIGPGRIGKIRVTLDSEKLMMNGLNQTNIYLARYMGDKVSEENEIVASAVLLPSFANLTVLQLAQAPYIVLMDGEEMLKDELQMADTQQATSHSKKSKKTKLTKTIRVTNIGEDTLEINAVQVFNRAVSVSLDNRVIPAHGTSKLKVTLDTQLLQKAKNKPRVLIISNDPRHAKTVLNLLSE